MSSKEATEDSLHKGFQKISNWTKRTFILESRDIHRALLQWSFKPTSSESSKAKVHRLYCLKEARLFINTFWNFDSSNQDDASITTLIWRDAIKTVTVEILFLVIGTADVCIEEIISTVDVPELSENWKAVLEHKKDK